MKRPIWFLVFICQCSLGRFGFSTDPDFCRDQSVNCVECDTSTDPNCGDPFNMRLMKQGVVPSVKCAGVCSKWVYGSGDQKRIRRTCSKNLELKKVSPYLVCIEESRGRGGSLCFCDQKNCNSASGPAPATFAMVTAVAGMRVVMVT